LEGKEHRGTTCFCPRFFFVSGSIKIIEKGRNFHDVMTFLVPLRQKHVAEKDADVNWVFLWMLQLNSSKADLLLISLGITWHLTHCNKVTNRRVMWTYNPYIKDG